MRSARFAISLVIVLFSLACGGTGEPAADRSNELGSTEWPMYRGQLTGAGYSAIEDVDASNVTQLEVAWSRSLGGAPTEDGGDPQRAFSQVTPIVVGATMYMPSADAVYALDATSGSVQWQTPIGSRPSRRGVAYWPGEGDTPPRVFVTSSSRLIALEAATGELSTAFGSSGEIDLGVPYLSVPLVFENLLIVGANTPRGSIGGIGNARAFDARTGEKVWEFSSVAQPGHLGHDTWGSGWEGRLGANAWPFFFTVDEERGHVYLPLAAPVPWAYGGDRPGANLFANSVVAVDVRTGEYAWHFQTIHHDLWDHDPPVPPTLFEAQLGSGPVDALAITTKSGYLFVLDRDRGEPLYGVEEKAMPASEVPGEQAFATQPIPVRPPALARVSYSPDDLVTAEDTSEEHAAACAELVANLGELHNEGPYTPWAHRAEGANSPTTLLFPGLGGGPNWGGVTFDPSSGYLLVHSADVGTLGWMEAADEDDPVPYRLATPRPASFDVEIDGQRLPCQKPPWGRLTAVDSATGEIAWQQAVGLSESLPEGKQATGRPGRAAPIVTASGLAFHASTDDNRFRAFDVETGEELWSVELPARGNANPMTYRGSDGRQYVVIVATEEVVAFALSGEAESAS